MDNSDLLDHPIYPLYGLAVPLLILDGHIQPPDIASEAECARPHMCGTSTRMK